MYKNNTMKGTRVRLAVFLATLLFILSVPVFSARASENFPTTKIENILNEIKQIAQLIAQKIPTPAILGARTDTVTGLVARYDMDSLPEGTIVGSPNVTTGQEGSGAYRFDGNDGINLGQPKELELTENLTLTAWVKPTSLQLSGWGRVISRTDGLTAEDWGIVISNKNYLDCRVNGNNVLSSKSLNLNIWQHVACTYDGSTLRGYINGVEVASKPVTGSLEIDNDVALGYNPTGGSTRYLVGSIDDVRVYNRALTVNDLGLVISGEPALVTDPAPLDTDSDAVPDDSDNCPAVANSNQADADNDEVGDACDSTPNGISNPNLEPEPESSITQTSKDDVVNVSSASQLASAIKNAGGGETIVLSSGNYGDLTISNRNFNGYLTIRSASNKGAKFGKITVSNSSYVKVENVEAEAAGNGVFYVKSSHHVALIDSEIHGPEISRTNPDYNSFGTIHSVYLDGTNNNIRIENNYVHDATNAITTFGASNVVIKGNKCDWVKSDCFKFSGVDKLLFENNFGATTVIRAPDSHVDYMQAQGPVSNGIFRGNVAIMGNESFQGLFFGGDEPHANNLVENNIILNSHGNTITFNDNSYGNVIRYNTAIKDASRESAINSFVGGGNSTVEYNVIGSKAGGAGISGTNHYIQYTDPTKSTHYSKYYTGIAKGAPNVTIEDFRPVAGSPADEKVGAYERIYELLNTGSSNQNPLPTPEPEPQPVDTDKDGVFDTVDNCRATTNPTQIDTDEDGIGDVCDTTPNGITSNDTDTSDSNTSDTSSDNDTDTNTEITDSTNAVYQLSQKTFDGTTASVVNLPHVSAYALTEGKVIFTFNAANVTKLQGLVVKDASGYGKGGHFATYVRDGKLFIRFQNSITEVYASAPIVANKDYTVVATFGPNLTTASLNGTSILNQTFNSSWRTNTEYLQIGGLGWSSVAGGSTFAYPFTGTIKNLTIAPSTTTTNKRIITTTNLNVRSTPNGTLLGQQSIDSYGVITDATRIASSGYNWVYVNFDIAPDGWVADQYISNTLTSSNSSSTKASLLAKIEELLALIAQLQAQLDVLQAIEG